MKTCTRCSRDLPLDQFRPRPGYKGGRTTWCNACASARNYEVVTELRIAIFNTLGTQCIRCKIDDIRVLCIDHVNGGGSKERRRIKGPARYYRYVLQQIQIGSTDYQVLCWNCNYLKRIENDENARRWSKVVVG